MMKLLTILTGLALSLPLWAAQPTRIRDGVLQTDLDAASHKIVNLAAPTSSSDAASKTYVDSFWQTPIVISDNILLLTDPSAILHLKSTTHGFLMPRMTTTQRNAISSPAAGLLIVNLDTPAVEMYNGSSWVSLAAGAVGSVTSVGLSTPSWLTVSGSPVTSSGTLAVTATSGQTANQVLATPDGTTGIVGLRALVAADIPSLAASKVAVSATQKVLGRNTAGAGSGEEVGISSVLDWLGSTRGSVLYRGASGWAIAAPGTAGYVLTANGAGADPTYQAPAAGGFTVTNYTRMPWTTLTLSDTNVSTIDFNAASMFKLVLTNNAFISAPSNLPGTNSAQVIQLHVAEDGTGGYSLTMTNSAWVLAGSGTATNAVVSLTTNANAVTILTFVTSPFSATKIYAVSAATGP